MFIIGHRGARAIEPENTLRALRRGMACADLVEVDVRLTRDGIPVVIHDATVDRTTDGTGPVKGYAIEDLKELDAGAGEAVPTLREVLDLVQGETGLVVEIKEPGTEAVIASVLMDRMPNWLFLVSFYPGSVAMAKRLLPGAQAGLIYSQETADPVGLAARCRRTSSSRGGTGLARGGGAGTQRRAARRPLDAEHEGRS
jgi:glycerophosphoryl diester phosphodiesterase